MDKFGINWNDWEETEEFDKNMDYLELVVHRIDGNIKRRLYKRKK
jgi:hypothetical protein